MYTTPYSGALKTAVEADTEVAREAASAGQSDALALAEQPLSSDPVDLAVIQPYFFPTAEGFYDYENKRYIYQYKDHLGNVRISYAKNTATGAAEYLNGNNYYPFGLNFINSGDSVGIYNPSTNYANYKYNGKELQETGAYDYGWRQYMPDLGRWNGMDKLSETYNSTSPYAYVMNNPVMFLDPDGRYTQSSGDNWLQDMWDNTTSYSSWSNTGNGSFKGGEIGMSSENFTSFYNFLSSGQTGSYTYWTGGAGSTTGSYNGSGMDVSMQGVVGNKIKIEDNGFWNDVMNKTADFFKDHFYAEGTAAIKHGMYASILLKNGFGGTLGAYSENRVTYSTDDLYHAKFTDTKKAEISAALKWGGGYSYDIENNTNQVTVGVLTFSAEMTQDNIFVGWTPNINLGIGVGGEAGAKIGFNFPTNGWANYNNWFK